jgi:hypothetical protein
LTGIREGAKLERFLSSTFVRALPAVGGKEWRNL